MVASNEIEISSGSTERIITGSDPRKLRIIVRDSDIRISPQKSNASNGALVEDQKVQPLELDAGEEIYAFCEGNSTARVEVDQ